MIYWQQVAELICAAQALAAEAYLARASKTSKSFFWLVHAANDSGVSPKLSSFFVLHESLTKNSPVTCARTCRHVSI